MISLDSRRAQWADMVSRQQASGLSAALWCRDNNIEANNFYNWRKRLSRLIRVESTEPASGQWLALGAADKNARSGGLTLRVGRVSIDVTPDFDRELLADVLTIAQSAC